jgi:hypothetical protein
LQQWSGAGERISAGNLWENAPLAKKPKEEPGDTERFTPGAPFIPDMRS